MARMGDKISAKRAMREADVPTVPGTEGETSVEAARRAADEMGYPILLKASAGGGGKGMRLVAAAEEIEDAFGAAAAEAQAAFGDPRSTWSGPCRRRATSRSRCCATTTAAC